MSRICPCYSQMDSCADLQWDSASREGRSVLRCTLRRLVTYGGLLIMILLCGTFPSSCNDTNKCSRIFTGDQLMHHLLISGVGLIVLVLPFLCSRPVAHSIGVIPSCVAEVVGGGGAPQFASPDGLFHPPCDFFFRENPAPLVGHTHSLLDRSRCSSVWGFGGRVCPRGPACFSSCRIGFCSASLSWVGGGDRVPSGARAPRLFPPSLSISARTPAARVGIKSRIYPQAET